MMRILAPWLLCGWILPAAAAPWEFDPPKEVASASSAGVFHHLESSGRKNIAVSGNTVAVVWEDNHSGGSQVYLATKSIDAPDFTMPRRVSNGRSAYEPVVVASARGEFLVGWEQDGEIWLRGASDKRLGAPQRLAAEGAAQVGLAAMNQTLAVVWAQRQGRFAHIRAATLTFHGLDKTIDIDRIRAVDARPPEADQAYPSVALTNRGWSVAWEDRRHGHTVLFYGHSRDGVTFTPPTMLNEQPPRRSTVYGKGPGVARVALTAYGPRWVAATWLDKRDFTAGYDVYAVMSHDGGRRFGSNRKVQDEFGNAISQWHPAIAGSPAGMVVIAWDDDRDETSDIWLSWREGQGWSADQALPGGSGPGGQASPSLVIDGEGRLHIVWVDREHPDGPTRIRYALGRPQK